MEQKMTDREELLMVRAQLAQCTRVMLWAAGELRAVSKYANEAYPHGNKLKLESLAHKLENVRSTPVEWTDEVNGALASVNMKLVTEADCGETSDEAPLTQQDARARSFAARALRIGKLVDEKNAAYGDSFQRSGEVMQALYPNGIKPEQYVDALGVVRVIDKLFRIATRKDAFGESPWTDIAGYGVVAGGKE